MKSYIVLLRDEITKEVSSTVCKTNDEIATLILHLDTKKYSIEKIEAISNLSSDINDFCIKNNKLETGEKEEVKQ